VERLEAAARRCHPEELQNVVSGGQMLPVALKYGTHQQRSISSRAPHLSRRCRLLREIGSEMGEREQRWGGRGRGHEDVPAGVDQQQQAEQRRRLEDKLELPAAAAEAAFGLWWR
jgi:hypothetical protein